MLSETEKPNESHLNARLTKLFDSPKHIIETDTPAIPVRMTGFLPILSESLLHFRTVTACTAKKIACFAKFDQARKERRNTRKPYQHANIKPHSRFVSMRDPNVSDELGCI
jgi:hypothetical protein